MLIGADGLWSNIRRQAIGDGAPRVSGHTTYRSVIPTEQMPEDLRWNAATLWAGPKCHIVHYPLSGWKVFNLVVTYHNDAPEPVAGKPVSEDEVMQGFTHVHARAQNIIRHGKDWQLWVLCDRDPNERWIDGRVALLGDAAAARNLHRLWYPFRKLARAFGQPQTTKAAMNLRGFDGGHVRLPLRDLSDSEKGQVAAVMEMLAADQRSGVKLAA